MTDFNARDFQVISDGEDAIYFARIRNLFRFFGSAIVGIGILVSFMNAAWFAGFATWMRDCSMFGVLNGVNGNAYYLNLYRVNLGDKYAFANFLMIPVSTLLIILSVVYSIYRYKKMNNPLSRGQLKNFYTSLLLLPFPLFVIFADHFDQIDPNNGRIGWLPIIARAGLLNLESVLG